MIRDLRLASASSPSGSGAVSQVWCSDLLAAEPRLVHAFTLRGLNLSLTGGGPQGRAVEDRRALCQALGLPFERLTVAQQVHGPEVLPVDDTLAGRGRKSSADAVPCVDGLYTRTPFQPLLGLSADCPLLVLFDPEIPAVGIAHAGWRGTLAGIALRMIQTMVRSLGTTPAGLFAAVSPSAGPCCYEVREDVLRLARTRWDDPDRYIRREAGRTYLDLWSANVAQLNTAGVPVERIDVAGLCTICDTRFCSYRRDGRHTRHAGLIAALLRTECGGRSAESPLRRPVVRAEAACVPFSTF